MGDAERKPVPGGLSTAASSPAGTSSLSSCGSVARSRLTKSVSTVLLSGRETQAARHVAESSIKAAGCGGRDLPQDCIRCDVAEESVAAP